MTETPCPPRNRGAILKSAPNGCTATGEKLVGVENGGRGGGKGIKKRGGEERVVEDFWVWLMVVWGKKLVMWVVE